MLICLRTSTCDVLHLLLLVSLVSICITKAASTVPSSNNENNNNNLIRRPDECELIEEIIFSNFIYFNRCHDFGANYRIETFECLRRWISHWRSITYVTSIFKECILFALWRLLYDIQSRNSLFLFLKRKWIFHCRLVERTVKYVFASYHSISMIYMAVWIV